MSQKLNERQKSSIKIFMMFSKGVCVEGVETKFNMFFCEQIELLPSGP